MPIPELTQQHLAKHIYRVKSCIFRKCLGHSRKSNRSIFKSTLHSSNSALPSQW